MRTLAALFVIAGLASACGTTGSKPPSSTAVAVLDGLAAAFSACDMPRLMSFYATDVEFAAPDLPQPILGKANLERHLQGACTNAFKPVMKVVQQRVTVLAPGAVLITGTYTIGRSDQPAEKPWSSHFVVTLQNLSGNWLIQSQASLPAAPAGTAG